MGNPLDDIIEIIHFTESVAARIHGVLDESEIRRILKDELAKSKHFSISILLLTEDEADLEVLATSIPTDRLQAAKKLVGADRIHLKDSTVFSRVIKGGETIRVKAYDIIRELLPRPIAYVVWKILKYEKRTIILTPLRRHGRIIGLLGVSSTELAEYLIISLREKSCPSHFNSL